MKYTQIPTNTFKEIQLNAGILVDGFNPTTGVIGNILGATTGGVQFSDAPSYTDFGEDIDNCPKNTMELKKMDSREIKMSGTFVTLSAATAAKLIGSADVDSNNASHIIPRNDILMTDFQTIWWIGDYSDQNTGDNAGFIAIKMLNALNTAGLSIQSTDKGKGQFAFEFTGHYSISAQDVVPYEVYIQGGGDEPTPSISFDKNKLELVEGGADTIVATVVPAGSVVTWTSSDAEVATVSGGQVTAVAQGTATITGTITVEDVEYSAECEVIVTTE